MINRSRLDSAVRLLLMVGLLVKDRTPGALGIVLDTADGSNLTPSPDLAPPNHVHAKLNVVELAEYYEYHAQVHRVLTDDGYVIEMHRLTGNKHNPSPKGKPAVLLQHGLLCSAMDWLITGPKRGLGFLLADAGYDVWLGNARGSKYSRKHQNLTTKDPEFWQFSWHEIGVYDLPAMVDYVLKKTGNDKITFVGHSQGSTTFYVMLSERPEYNDKITAMIALAPVAYCSHMSSPVFRTLGKLTPFINYFLEMFGQYEFTPSSQFFKRFASIVCNESNISQPICTNVIFLICGFSEDQIDRELLPDILAHVPAGSSTKQFVHYAQLISSGHFRQIDLGWWNNWRKYGSFSPPSYKLENVKIPISLHYSVNDWLANIKDIEQLYSHLPNKIGKFIVPHEKFNHLDYLWAKDVKSLLYDKVLNIMTRFKY